MQRLRLISALVPMLVASCGGGTPQPKSADSTMEEKGDEGGAEAAQSAAAADFPAWSEQNRSQRLDYMSFVVLPAMQEVFSGEKDFGCKSCHGEDMKDVDYKMPNDLYALPKEGTLESARDYDADTTKFMVEVVSPKMAELLKVEHTPGSADMCFHCHLTE